MSQHGSSSSSSDRFPGRYLTGLRLVAVQPACLGAHPDTPLQHHDAQPAQPAAAAQQLQQQQVGDLQHHDLLLQLQATLAQQQDQSASKQQLSAPGQLTVSAVTAGATPESCHLLPLSVQKAVLQVVLLNRQMQVLLHKQYNFQDLLQEQQAGLVGSSSSNTCGDGHSSIQKPQAPTAADVARSSGCGGGGSSSSDPPQVLLLNIRLSAPSQPSAHVLDALHLFVTLCAAQLAEPVEAVDAQAQQPACLVAELPLLVMPALAQQEVQQLLLPAMRQDVQSEQLLQTEEELLQQQQGRLSPADIAARALQVECAVWKHFNQLALDILLIMQLSEAVRAEAEQAAGTGPDAASSALASSQPVEQPAAGPSAAADAPGMQQQQQHADQQQLQADQHEQHAAAAAAVPTSLMDSLLQAVDTLLLPLLLPFLTAHGLHNTLQVLLQCLPSQLQLQQHWQQQQLARLHALSALPQPLEQQQQHAQELPGQPALPAAAAAAGTAVGAGAAGDVIVSSALLDAPAAPADARTDAPASADYAVSSKSGSLFESGESSPAEDWEAVGSEAHLQQQQQLLQQAPDASSSHEDHRNPQQQQQQQEQPMGVLGDPAMAGMRRRGGSAGQGPAAAVQDVGQGDRQGLGAGGSAQDRSRASSSSSISSGRNAGRGAVRSRFQHNVLTRTTGIPCWLVPFKQFPDTDMERRYVAFKHQHLLYLDVLGGFYQLAVAAALTKNVLFEHPATLILLLLTLIKALPHVPLLLGYRHEHTRFRELWMFLAAPFMGLLLCFLVFFTSAWQPSTMPPMPHAYYAFWAMHGELITAALRTFFQHMRLRPFIVYTLVDRVISMQLWAPFCGVMTAVGRSSLAGLVSVAGCWALELCCRRRFVMEGLYVAPTLAHGVSGGAGGGGGGVGAAAAGGGS